MKKTIALLLALCLILGIQAGALADLDKTKGTPERAEAEAKTFAMYPIDPDGNITLDIWLPFNSTAAKYIESYNENEALQAAAVNTGIKLNFISPALGQEKEQFNLLMAGGDLPDIVMHSNYYPGGAIAGVTDGVFAELTDLIHEYSPTYAMILDNVDGFWKDATDLEGRVYAYYLYKEAKSEEEGDHTRIIVREDWLKEAGLEALYTVEDYETFFQYILENKEGVVPYTPDKAGYSSRALIPYGIQAGYYVVDGKIHHFMNEPALKDYLILMNSWYEKGYISPDFTSANATNLLYEGTTAAIWGAPATTAIKSTETGIPYASQPYMRLEEGQQLHGVYKLNPVNSSTSLTQICADSDYIKEAMMFLDYGFTVAGSWNYGFGPEGTAWVLGEDGTPEYTDYILHNDRFASVTDVNYVIRYHTGMAFMRPLDQESIPYFFTNPEASVSRLKWMDDPNVDLDTCLPTLVLGEDEAAERAAIMTDVETYANEMILKFIVGAEPIENFDKYLATVEAYQIGRAIELTQEAYEVYMSKTR